MVRANRHYIPNYIWHITHRCHKQEFLLKFARDRQALIALLEPGEITLTIFGELMDGTKFRGSDTIRVIDKGKHKRHFRNHSMRKKKIRGKKAVR